MRLKAFTNGLSTHDVKFAEALRAEGLTAEVGEPLLVSVWCDGIFRAIGRFDWETESVYPEKLYIL